MNKYYGTDSKLDKLVYDKNLIARLTITKQRYRFDMLVNDEYPYI